MRQGPQRVGHFLHDAVAFDWLQIQLHFAGLDLSQIKKIVDEAEQMAATTLDGPKLLLLVWGKRAGQLHQKCAGKTNDGI